MGAMAYQHTVTLSSTRTEHAFHLGRLTRSVSGFSLVEVLVSIVVLSFGLLGMVGMQATSLQSNREARLQSSAVVLARELAEMIRSNKAVGISTTAATNPYLGSFSSPLAAPTPVYCLNVAPATTACSGAINIANAQMTEWLARVDAELPGARVDVCFDTEPFDSSGLPQWACTAGTGGVIMVKMAGHAALRTGHWLLLPRLLPVCPRTSHDTVGRFPGHRRSQL